MDRLIRDTEAAAILGCSRGTIWKLVKDGQLPAPIKVGSMARWRLSELQARIAKAEQVSRNPTPPRIRQRRAA